MKHFDGQKRSIVLYAPSDGMAFRALCKCLEKEFLSGQLEPVNGLDLFSKRFRQLNHGISAVVILLPTQGDLDDMLAIRHLLEDLPVILILGERDNDTLSKAHRLSPRYMGDMDSDFQDIVAVLAKITRAHMGEYNWGAAAIRAVVPE